MIPKLVPALIPQTLKKMRAHIDSLILVTQTFQIDIVDGEFVPFTSWPYKKKDVPREINQYIEGLDIEFDLMIQNPEDTLDAWLETMATRFVIHVESTKNVSACVEKIKEAEKKVGLALNNDTDLFATALHVSDIDFIQCMGIKKIGKQGSKFDERVISRIEDVRTRYPEMEISVDGSMNQKTIPKVIEAGANRVVSGSALLKSDSPSVAFTSLQQLISRYAAPKN